MAASDSYIAGHINLERSWVREGCNPLNLVRSSQDRGTRLGGKWLDHSASGGNLHLTKKPVLLQENLFARREAEAEIRWRDYDWLLRIFATHHTAKFALGTNLCFRKIFKTKF